MKSLETLHNEAIHAIMTVDVTIGMIPSTIDILTKLAKIKKPNYIEFFSSPAYGEEAQHLLDSEPASDFAPIFNMVTERCKDAVDFIQTDLEQHNSEDKRALLNMFKTGFTGLHDGLCILSGTYKMTDNLCKQARERKTLEASA